MGRSARTAELRQQLGVKSWIAIAVACLLPLVLTSPVSASTLTREEVGNPCVADGIEPEATLIGENSQGSEPFTQPDLPPEGRWVITRWKVRVGAGMGQLQQQLVAGEEAGTEAEPVWIRKAGESSLERLVAGTNEFPTRVPVREGDRIGLTGPEGALVCHQAMNLLGRVKGSFATGETRRYEVLTNLGVPATVTFEPDRDGDGYGDLTQDECPWLAVAHEHCRTPTISAVPTVGGRAIVLQVKTGVPTTATVSGFVKWTEALTRHRRQVTVDLPKVSLPVGFEATATFTVPLPNRLLRHLAKLPRSRSLTAKLTISAVEEREMGGASFRLNVRLPGRQAPRHSHPGG